MCRQQRRERIGRDNCDHGSVPRRHRVLSPFRGDRGSSPDLFPRCPFQQTANLERSPSVAHEACECTCGGKIQITVTMTMQYTERTKTGKILVLED